MLIHIDDDLYAKYAAAALQVKRPARDVIEQQLLRFLDYPPTRRAVVLSEETLAEIEQALGGGSLVSEQDLLAKIHNWAGITIGHVRLQFSPEQLREIGLRAQKQGKSPRTVVEDIVTQLEGEFFWQPTVLR